EVHGAAALLGDLAGEVDGEAEGVVQEEHVVALDVAASEDVVEEVEAAFEGLAEPLLLPADGAGHEVVLGDDVGVGVAHGDDGGVDEGWGDDLGGAEQEG